MEKKIKKLIAEYQEKINICDIQLNGIQKKNAIARRNGDELEQAFLGGERSRVNAQRQAYVQAGSDIDSLLDYV